MAIGVSSFYWRGNEIQDDVSRRITAQMLALGRQVVAIAERLAPKKTGRLATSISFDWNQADFTLVFLVDALYGMFQEFGTRNIPPHPYMRPALNMVGSVFGFNLEMAFANLPPIHAPLITHGAGFHLPSTLTGRQLAHVRRHLLPTSKRHHIGNVKRARVHVRQYGGDRPG